MCGFMKNERKQTRAKRVDGLVKKHKQQTADISVALDVMRMARNVTFVKASPELKRLSYRFNLG
jgi:hypothetical protein